MPGKTPVLFGERRLCVALSVKAGQRFTPSYTCSTSFVPLLRANRLGEILPDIACHGVTPRNPAKQHGNDTASAEHDPFSLLTG